jgi:hypothetical protein
VQFVCRREDCHGSLFQNPMCRKVRRADGGTLSQHLLPR